MVFRVGVKRPIPTTSAVTAQHQRSNTLRFECCVHKPTHRPTQTHTHRHRHTHTHTRPKKCGGALTSAVPTSTIILMMSWENRYSMHGPCSKSKQGTQRECETANSRFNHQCGGGEGRGLLIAAPFVPLSVICTRCCRTTYSVPFELLLLLLQDSNEL